MQLELVRLLREHSEGQFRLLGASVVTGLANAAILMVIASAAQHIDQGVSLSSMGLFLIFTIAYLVTKRHVLDETSRITQAAIDRYRIRIAAGVRDAALADFERLPRSRILSALVDSAEIIAQGAYNLAKIVPAFVMILASLGYIAYLSQAAFFLAVLAFTLMIAISQAMNRAMGAEHMKTMAKGGEFLAALEQLLSGFKELKASRARRADLFDGQLARISGEARDLHVTVEKSLTRIELTMFCVFYALFGSVVFALPQFTAMTPARVIAITTILCFIAGNFEIVIQGLPKVFRADQALRSLAELEGSLGKGENLAPAAAPSAFEQLELRGVGFAYRDEEERSFSIGPGDLTVRRGELVLIRGGNGSGKSTLLKLIAGLYRPDLGEIRLNGEPVSATDLNTYRELFAPIFTDFHLFDRLYGVPAPTPETPPRWLSLLRLTGKTAYEDGRFTNLKLSTGQRKRLALVAALLDERQILLLDEFAADQDPEFKDFFYTDLLKTLRAAGKTVIAITHDDRYLDAGDQVLTMDYGRFELTRPRVDA